MYTAIVSGHIFIDQQYGEDVEILSQIDNDYGFSEVFTDITNALSNEITFPEGSTDYYFMAIVQAEFVSYDHVDGREYDTDYYVTEIKSITDLTSITKEMKQV